MIKADAVAVVLVAALDDEYFAVAHPADIVRLYEAGHAARVWDIKLDNGHRPYPSLRKRIDYVIGEAPAEAGSNAFTQLIAARTGLTFAATLHPFADTYLFRKTAAFWDELWLDFAVNGDLPPGHDRAAYHAIYRGVVLPVTSNIKITRIQ